jgi:hypothetical protein
MQIADPGRQNGIKNLPSDQIHAKLRIFGSFPGKTEKLTVEFRAIFDHFGAVCAKNDVFRHLSNS